MDLAEGYVTPPAGDAVVAVARVPGETRISSVEGFDPGAVCADGLTEMETMQTIARLTAARLRRAGAQVDVLDEYDPRLASYQVDVLVSIHADSCEVERSGYKVARSNRSSIPALDDALVSCLTQSYREATGLAFDADTVTTDMTEYHAFQRIAESTPAAIIETGFLSGDRRLLADHPQTPAQGIANGVICFLDRTRQAAAG